MGLRGAAILAGLGQGLNQGISNFVNIRRMLSDEKMRRGQLQAMAEFDAPPNMVDVGETINLPPGATGGNVPASVLARPRDYSEMDLGELMHLSTLGNLRRQRAEEARKEQEGNKDMQPVTLPEIRIGDRPAAKGDISEIIREVLNQSRQTEGLSLLSPDEAAAMIPDQQGYGNIKGKTIVPEMTVPRVALEDVRSIRGKIAESALETKKPEKMEGPFSKIEPHHYTPESIAKFNQTGNHADLIPRGSAEVKAPTMRSYESGDEKITEEWDSTGKAWKEVGRSKVVRGQRLGFINEKSLRQEFNHHPVVKDFREVTGKYSNMEQAIKEAQENPSSMVAVDQALITMFNKMLDPQSVVRESEYARTPEDIGLFNRLVGKVEKLRSGGAGLTDEERNALVRMARRFYEVSQARYTETKDFFSEISVQNGIEPNRVIQTISGVGSGAGNATGGASLPGALPPGVPPGSKQIGTKNGNPVYETPDGKRFMVTP